MGVPFLVIFTAFPPTLPWHFTAVGHDDTHSLRHMCRRGELHSSIYSIVQYVLHTIKYRRGWAGPLKTVPLRARQAIIYENEAPDVAMCNCKTSISIQWCSGFNALRGGGTKRAGTSPVNTVVRLCHQSQTGRTTPQSGRTGSACRRT